MRRPTKEDIEYRQGRSAEQVEACYFMVFVSVVCIAAFLLGYILMTVFNL